MGVSRPGISGVQKIQKGPLREQVQVQIKQLILTNRLRPGQTIVIDRLASDLGVSHTPVREALAMLQHDGLVITRPYGNPQVTPIDDSDVHDAWEMRLLLEGWAVSKATSTLSDQDLDQLEVELDRARQDALRSQYDSHLETDIAMHNMIVNAADNKLFDRLAQLVGDQSVRIRSLVEAIAPVEEVLTIVDEHCSILEALRARDAGLSRERLVAHLEAGKVRTLAALEKMKENEGRAGMKAAAPIGIFDSGRGLAVLREVRRLLPHEHVLFLGDTARQPYGPRPVDDVRRFAVEITGYLAQQGVKMVIIACNTASVAGRAAAQRCFPDLPVLGMIEPGVDGALAASARNRIGVWGTALTVDNKAYDRLLLQHDPEMEVLGAACPELLRLAEKGQIDDRPHLIELARRYFQPLADFGADTLILGCTDLTCVRDIAEEVAGDGVTVVDPAEEVVRQARRILQDTGALRESGATAANYRFLITGEDLANFGAFTARFLDLARVDLERVELLRLKQAASELDDCP